MKHARVNIRTVANTAAIRRETRNGREKIIVPSATLPDGVIMNSIMYPADEIEKGYASLNMTPAPLGHPTVNGLFVSASHPDGINAGWIGAHNENVRRENGRVFLDKVIDVQRANESEGGRKVIAAINEGKPINTSTGLLMEMEAVNAADHKFIARNMVFDHDAILLDEPGAATPDQGVGMMVNSEGKSEEIQVINSIHEDEANYLMERAADMAIRAMEASQKAPLLERMKAAITEVFAGTGREPSLNEKESEMTDKVQFDALSEKVNALTEANEKMGETITNAVTAALKPVLDAQAELTANAQAKDDAELATHVAAIVKANILDEDSAKELTLNAARKLAEKAKPGSAAALNAAFTGTDEKPAFQLPKGEK